MNSDIEAMVKATIQTQILKSFKDTPEVVDELVKAALGQEVDQHGGKPDYHTRERMPYLTWIVGDTIRRAARESVLAAVSERKEQIDAAVRKAISADNIVDGLVKTILGALDQDYRVEVKFADENGK